MVRFAWSVMWSRFCCVEFVEFWAGSDSSGLLGQVYWVGFAMLLISEVKQHLAVLVLIWVTAWEQA